MPRVVRLLVVLFCVLALRSAAAGEPADALPQDKARILAYHDHSSLSTILRDVSRAYAPRLIAVMRRQDCLDGEYSDDRRKFAIQNATDADFCKAITRTFDAYACAYDPETRYWLIYPADGQGAMFQDVVQFDAIAPTNNVEAVSTGLRGITNACRLLARHESNCDKPAADVPVYYARRQHEERPLDTRATSWKLPAGSFVRWKRLAQTLNHIPRSYLLVYLTTLDHLRPRYAFHSGPPDPWDLSEVAAQKLATARCFWAMGIAKDWSAMSDDAIVAALRLGVLWNEMPLDLDAQLWRMDTDRLSRIYGTMDSTNRHVFGRVFYPHAALRYSDVGIRMAADNLRSPPFASWAMPVLLDNCYSEDVQQLVSAMSVLGSKEWKASVYREVVRAPGYISDAQRAEWLHALEVGRHYARVKSALDDGYSVAELSALPICRTNDASWLLSEKN
ncbi:MAG: hypothetical protein WCR06_09405, partial [bacterium]